MASAAPPTPNRASSPEHTVPVTDFALIESQKENIRPLASGRSAAALGAVFGKSEETSRALEEETAKFLKDIEEAERREREAEDCDLDVLDVYSRYIKFLFQHHPSSPQRILPTLESTTRRFIEDDRYKQDARYLKLWVLYARHVERREEVWAFLESRDIGTRHASFYEEWAMASEGLGRKKKADDIYRLGIHRKAMPLERLKNRHQAFLTRIMAPPSGVVPDDEPESTAPPSRQRTALAGGSTQQGGVGGRSLSTGKNGAKLQIFSDADGRSEEPEPAVWNDFGTRDGRRKENTVESTPWKGTVLPQSSTHRTPRTPKLEVFKDGEDNTATVRTADDGSLRSKAPLSEADLLLGNPLKNYNVRDISTGVPSLPPPPTTATRRPLSKREPSKRDKAVFKMEPWVCPTGGAESRNSKGKVERVMFDWDATFRGGEEWSFEEVRARKLGLLGKDWKELKEWERSWHKPGSTTPQPKKVQRPPSPTVNTKLANEEVLQLFNQTIGPGKRRVRDDSDDDSDSDDDEDDDHVAPLPTPLPVRQPTAMAMMTPGGMVPPTPTPAPGQSAGFSRGLSAPQTPNIFADENVPSSVRRKLNIFADENTPSENAPPQDENASAHRPARTPRAPLGMRTPLTSSKPRVFADENDQPVYADENRQPVFADENDQAWVAGENHASAMAAENHRPVFADENDAQVNVFATPAPVRTSPIREEPENESAARAEDEAEPEFQQHPLHDAHHPEDATTTDYDCDYYDDDEDRPTYGRQLNRWGYRSVMTPVTERTYEYTNLTNGTRRSSLLSDDGEGATRVESVPPALESVQEESPGGVGQRVSSAAPTDAETDTVGSAPTSAGLSFRHDAEDADADGDAEYDRSGAVDVGAFDVPEGFTIHRSVAEAHAAASMMHSLEIVDHADSQAHRSSNDDCSPAPVSPMASGAASPANPSASPAHHSPLAGSSPYPASSPAAPASRSPPAAPSSSAVSPPRAVATQAPIPTSSSSSLRNPCNPGDDAVISALLARIDPPLSSLRFIVDRLSTRSARLNALQKATAHKPRRSINASRVSLAAPEDAYVLELGGTQYEINHKLGEGGFGAVFLAEDMAARAEDDDNDDSEEDEEEAALIAIKVEAPSSMWEAVMLDRVHCRVSESLAHSIIRPRGLHAYADESFLLLDYSAQGTLLDIVNKASVWGVASSGSTVPEEILSLFFTVELLRLVEGLHAADIIHGDLKIDNCLVRIDDVPATEGGKNAWKPQYDRTGSNGWKHKGVRLIDFGRSADLTLFPAGTAQTFVADWRTDARDCPEMRDGRPWSYETDYFGLAGVCYCLLFGKYIATEVVETSAGKQYKIDQPFKRYWQTPLWTKLFHALLNPRSVRSDGTLPITSELGSIRAEFEACLEANCERSGKSLKQLLNRIALKTMERR